MVPYGVYDSAGDDALRLRDLCGAAFRHAPLLHWCVLIACAMACVGSGCAPASEPSPGNGRAPYEQSTSLEEAGYVWPAAYFAARLAEGDFRYEAAPGAVRMPFHVARLCELGHAAGPEMLGLLSHDQPTPFGYRDVLTFRLGLRPSAIHTATVADLADYVLRRTYKTDVGFRSHLSTEARQAAIERWRDVVLRSRLLEWAGDLWRRSEAAEDRSRVGGCLDAAAAQGHPGLWALLVDLAADGLIVPEEDGDVARWRRQAAQASPYELGLTAVHVQQTILRGWTGPRAEKWRERAEQWPRDSHGSE